MTLAERDERILAVIERIAVALERIAGAAEMAVDFLYRHSNLEKRVRQ